MSTSYSFDWQEPVILFDFQKSVAPSKPLVDLEYHYGEAPNLSSEYTRATYFQSYLHGLRKSEFWVWSKGEIDHGKPQGDGMKNTNWSQPKCAWGTCTSALDLRRISKYIAAFPQRPEVMIYFSKPSLYLDQGLASQGVRVAHESLNGLDAPVGFVTDKMIRAGKLSGVKLLVVSNARYVQADVAKAIASFVAKGGHIILLNECFVKDEFRKPVVNSLESMSGVIKVSGSSPKEFVPSLDAALDDANVSRQIRALAQDGKPAWPVECRTAIVDGKRICYIIGLNKEPVKLRLSSNPAFSSWEDLLTGEKGSGDSFELKQLDVKLLALP